MAERILTRSELYEAVWSRPVRQVAADIGVSDVAVAKACRKMDIPLPWRGYWRQRECGHKPTRPALPAWPKGGEPAITFQATDKPEHSTPAPEELAFELRPENRITVRDNVEKPHRLVRRTLAALRKRKPDWKGLLTAAGADRFIARVSPASLDRTARILDALIGAFDSRGYAVVEGDDDHPQVRVRVADELLVLELSERTKRVVHQLTEREEIRAELNPDWRPPLYDTVPTGTLVIRIVNSPFHSQRSAWRDRHGTPLEERLNEVLAGMAEAARVLKEQREEAERRQREWEEEQRKQEEARERAELAQARHRKLADLSRQWQEWEAIHRFLEAARDRMKVARPELVPTAQAWLDWAEAYLDEHRPTDVIFFDRVTERDDHDFWHYAHDGTYGRWG
jgi:hypothetical protein